MNKKLILITLIALIILSASAGADVIYLYNGEIYSGNIIRENSTYVRIDTMQGDDGRIKEFLRNDIASVKYGIMKADEMPSPSFLPSKESTPVRTFRKIIRVPDHAEVFDESDKLSAQNLPVPDSSVTIPPEDLLAKTKNQSEVERAQISRVQEPESKETEREQEMAPEDHIKSFDMSDEQVAEMEEQVQSLMELPNIYNTAVLALAAFWGTAAVPFVFCGILGIILARKFDRDEQGAKMPPSGLVEARKQPAGLSPPKTKYVRTPYESPYPAKEVPIESRVEPKIEKQESRGGLIRRGIARIIDLYLGGGLVLIAFSLPGLWVPLDQKFVLLLNVVLLPMTFILLLYFFLGVGKLDNTYGRYLMNVKVVDMEKGSKPTLGQAFKRDFALFLWPLDFFILILGKSKRRIGDCWARTKVIVPETSVFWFRRLLPGLLVGICIYGFIPWITPLINDRMVITQEAKTFLVGEYGPENLTRPQRVEIFNDEGRVNFKLKNGESYSVHLKQYQDKWAVRKIHKIPDAFLNRGFSIRFGS